MMKRNFWTLILIFAVLTVEAQTVTQRGVAYQYNGKKQRTPLGNVTITYDANKRTTISGEQDGTFALTLDGKRMGDRIGLVTVRKREMMVFNQHAVDEWSVRREPLMLILCNAEEFERQKENLINIGRREAKKKYDRQKAELEAKLQASEIQRAEYEAALDKAYDELDRLNKNVGEYADLFARIDESEIDTLAQRAMDLYNEGRVEEAIRLFEQGNYMEKLEQDYRVAEQADQMMATAQQAKEDAERSREAHLQSLQAQVRAYRVQGDYKKAGKLMKQMADRVNDVNYLTWYAEFCNDQRDYAESEVYWRKSLQQVDIEEKPATENYTHRKAVILMKLGNSLVSQKKFAEGEQLLSEAIGLQKQLVQDYPDKYERFLSSSLNELGNYYENIRDYQQALNVFNETLAIDRKLAERDSSFEWNVSLVLNNIGLLYMRMGRYQESIETYEQCRLIQKRYLTTYPHSEGVKYNYAGLSMNLGVVYRKCHLYEQAEQAFSESVSLLRQLADKNSDAYSSSYYLSLAEYANLDRDMERNQEAVQKYQETIRGYRELEQAHPWVYTDDLARVLNHYGWFCSSLKDFAKAEEILLESFDIRKKQAKRYPLVYSYTLIESQKALLALAMESRQFDKGESWVQELSATINRLLNEDREKYEGNAADGIMAIGNFYGEAGRLEESITALKEALEMYRRIAQRLPAYESHVANVLYNIGITYYQTKQYEQAVQACKESLTSLGKLRDANYDLDRLKIFNIIFFAYKDLGEIEETIDALKSGLEYARRLEKARPSGIYQQQVAITLGRLSYYSILIKQYADAESYAREGLIKAPDLHVIATNLAAALLFQGKYAEAEKIYREYKSELKESFLDDFRQFAEAGVIPKEREADVERIKRMLEE